MYRVRLGRDEYLGSADEVLAFMAAAEGSPDPDPMVYMRLVAQRLAARMGLGGVPTNDAQAFLEHLAQAQVLRLESLDEPSPERVDPRLALGEDPVVYGEGVSADDLPDL